MSLAKTETVTVRSQTRPPTCKYEKARRDRLNLFITELSTFLPEQNPTKSLSKIDVLEKIVQLIKDLLDNKEKLANKNCVDDCLKQELKELKATVSDLKARIVILNKILNEANVSVPLDLEVPHFDKNFTPHLKYSCRKKALTCQSTQTQEVVTCNKNDHGETQEKENEEQTVGKLISFTQNLKPPLQEIQENVSRRNEKIAAPVACHVLPPHFIVLPLYPVARPAMTQLTFSNKRPISSYTDFQKVYTQQQEKLASKTRRRHKQRSGRRKKCSCQTVVLKKPGGTMKKIIKLCAYKSCKNKIKFRKIHEAAKQQLSEHVVRTSVEKHSAVDTTRPEDQLPVANNEQTMEVYSEQELMVSLSTRNTDDTKLYEVKDTTDKHAIKFEKETTNSYSTKNAQYEFSNPTQQLGKADCYYPCANYFSPVDTSSSYAVENGDLNYDNMKQDTGIGTRTHHASINSKSHDSRNTTHVENTSTVTNVNQKAAHLSEDISNENHNASSLNVDHVNEDAHSIQNLDQKSAMETCVSPILGAYVDSNKLDQTERPVEQATSDSNACYIHNKNTRIDGNKMNDISNNISHINNDNSNNISRNSAAGSYSINSVIFSRRSHNTDTRMYPTPNCTSSKHINSDMSHNQSTNVFGDETGRVDQRVLQSNAKTNNVQLSKQAVRKNLNFSFENLGSNVMSSESSTGFGYNVSSETGTSGTLYPPVDSNYNMPETHQPTFSYNTSSYVEPSQGKSSCYFESYPNALHFPYVPPSDKSIAPVTKFCEEKKRKAALKQKTQTGNTTSHDISQNIFEVNNKENSFDFLFGKQNSLNTPQKSKRKSDSCFLSEKSFLPDEMKFHSEFSNDLFSLPGQVGGCVSPTAAFLLTFPVVSSKQTDLTDHIDSGNTVTPIGNIESLSQDLPDLTFKSNMKGLFDPFYPSCIGTDTKLNFDFNPVDNVAKANFPPYSEENNVTTLPWSAHISCDDSHKKKIPVESVSSVTPNKAKVKSSHSIAGSEGSHTLFSYPGGSDSLNNTKTLVNWMTSAGTQEEKNPTDKDNKLLERPPPVEAGTHLFLNNKSVPAFTGSFSIASFSNTMSSTNAVNKSSSLTIQDASVASTFSFYGDTKSASDKPQEHQPAAFTSAIEFVPSSYQSKTQSQTHSSYCVRNNINETAIIKSDKSSPLKKYGPASVQENTDPGNINIGRTKTSFDVCPGNTFENKSSGKSCDQFVCPPIQYYSSNNTPSTTTVCSSSSNFLSVSQLVDPVKPEIKHASNFVQSFTTKSNSNVTKKDTVFQEGFKEPIENDNKYNNYSTEALLSSRLKHQHDVPPMLSGNNSKTRYKRKRSNSKTNNNVIPVNFSSIYNVTTTTASNVLHNTASYDAYCMGSTSTMDSWNHNCSSKPSSSSTYTCFDSTANKHYLEPSHENVPLVSQNYFTPTTSTSLTGCYIPTAKHTHDQISTFTSSLSGQSYVTSSSCIPLSQQSYGRNKQFVSSKHRNPINNNQSTQKTGSASVGTQVITSSFPYLPTPEVKPVSSTSNFSLSSSSKTTTSLKTVQLTSSINIVPSSWHMSSLTSYSSAKLTGSSLMPNLSSTIAIATSNSYVPSHTMPQLTFSSVPFTKSSTCPNLNTGMTNDTSFKSSFVSSLSSQPTTTSLAVLSKPTTCLSGSCVSTVPSSFPSAISTSVTYSSHSAGSFLIAPTSYSIESGQRMASLYMPASNAQYSSVSKALPSTNTPYSSSSISIQSPKLGQLKTQTSSKSHISLNAPITSTLPYTALNIPITSSVSYTSLNTPLTSSISYSALNTPNTSSTSHNLPNTTITSSISYSALNTAITSSIPSVLPNTPITSSIPYATPNTTLTSSISYSSTHTPISSNSLSYASLNTPMTSSVTYPSHNTPIISSIPYATVNTPTNSSFTSNTSLHAPKTSSASSASINFPVSSSSILYTPERALISSSILYTSINTPVASSGVSYTSRHTLKNSCTSSSFIKPPICSSLSFTSNNTPMSSCSPSYTSLYTPITSSLSYTSVNSPISSSNLLYTFQHNPRTSYLSSTPINTPICSSSLSYTSRNTPITSSISYTPTNTPISSYMLQNTTSTNAKICSYSDSLSYISQHTPITSSLSYTSINTPTYSSSQPYMSQHIPITTSINSTISSSNLSYISHHTPITASLLYTPINTPITSSSSSYMSHHTSISSSLYGSINTPISLSSVSHKYTSVNAPITTSSPSYMSQRIPITTSVTSSYMSLNTPISSSLSYTSINARIPSSSLSYTISPSSVSAPYTGVSLYPPVTSSVTDFNLSTIFPEINVKNQTPHSRETQPKNYQRCNKSSKS